MFKFLKSKKGFTLVELMIVVVIMAILVAVAVPIYSAVTKNARKKTCLANQREIVSQLTNAEMAGTITLATGDTFTLTTEDGAENGTWNKAATDKKFADLFQKAPFCPVEGNVITVTVAAAGDDGFKITTKCEVKDGTENHGA